MIPLDDIKTKYGNEIALVLLCCRIHFNTEERITLQEFIDNNAVDWKHVQYLSEYHRIEPIVYKILTNANLPKETALQIKQKQLYLVQQCFQRALETERIINLLRENGISCTPYKGIAFSKQFYGDIVSRESSDIDLVVAPGEFGKVMELMTKDGYSFENHLIYDYYKEDIYKQIKELCFNKYANGIRTFHIEFHWKISDNRIRLKKKADALLYNGGAEEILVKNNIKMLNINAHYVAVFIHHSMNDMFSILRNIVDLSQIIKCSDAAVNINYIEDAFFELNLQKAASACCFLSEELLGVALPFSTKKTATVLAIHEKTYFTELLLKREMIGDRFKTKLFDKGVLYLKDNTAEKAKYLIASLQLRFIPSPKDIRTFRLPKGLRFFYVILKPFRMLLSPSNLEEDKEIARQEAEE